MPITTLPALDRTSVTFKSDADDFFGTKLPAFAVEANALEANVNAKGSSVNVSAANAAANATSSATSAASANAAATNALGAAGAGPWVSGTTYAIGTVKYSLINFRSYRRIIAGAGTTDPSLDTTNWAAVLLDIVTGLPSISPSFLAHFANSGKVDPRFVCTRASSAVRSNRFGLLEVMAVDTPRIGYDPVTCARKGLQLESAATNLVTYSENFNNAAYTKAQSSILAYIALGPDGNMSAAKLVENTTNNSHALTYPLTVTAQNYVASVYAKAGERSLMALVFWDGTTTRLAYFDLAAGTVSGNANILGSTIRDDGDGWYRCSITLTATAGTGNIAIYNAVPGNTVYAGDGTSGLYIYGLNVIAGTVLSSYIPNANTFISRASTATYINAMGVISPSSIDDPRINYNPEKLSLTPKLLLENAATNLLLNSTIAGTNLATQSITTTAAARTLSFYGTGTVSLSGTATGTVVGLGAYPKRTTYTYLPSAGSLTLTVSGTVQFANDELGSYATSFMPTAGASATRAADISSSAATTRSADVVTMSGTNFTNWYRPDEGSLVASMALPYNSPSASFSNSLYCQLSDGTGNNQIYSRVFGLNNVGVADSIGRTNNVSQFDFTGVAAAANTFYKSATSYKLNNAQASVAGVANESVSTYAVPKISQLSLQGDGYVAFIAYYPKQLTTELQALSL